MTRFLLVGTVTAAIAMFAWQTVSNAVLPWHNASLDEFTDPDAVAAVVRENAPAHGVYYARQGVLAAVATTPGVDDVTKLPMGRPLAWQFLIDLFGALALAFVVLRLRLDARTAPLALGLAALAVAGIGYGSDWNWYGTGAAFSLVNTADLTINAAFAGLVLGWVRGRMETMAHPATVTPPMAERTH